MFDLSIVLPTCNRASLLKKAIDGIVANTRCRFQIIVVDGASTDQTEQVLANARNLLGDKLTVIREEKREGFVRAANKGFRAATGRYLTWLNDDARAAGDSLDRVVEQLNYAEPDIAFLAMFHRWHSQRNVAYETQFGGRKYQLCHIRGTLYANFPVGRRDIFEKLGFFDERYFVCAADPDLSLKAWHAGLRVLPAFGVVVDHDEVDDDRRLADSSRGREDNDRLFAKWNLPPRNPARNDFDPAKPCTLIGLRTDSVAA